MRSAICGISRGIALAACVLVVSVPAISQVGPAGARRPGAAGLRPPAPNFAADFKALTDQVAAKYRAKVFVDPALWVPTKPSPPTGSTLEGALDSLVAQVKGTVWRRAYLKDASVASPERLIAAARALEMVQESGLVLENPAAGRATTYLKNAPVPPNFVDALASQQFAPAPVYVVFGVATGTPAGASEDRFLDLQRQQLDLLMQMNPDQLTSAMSRGMQLWQNLDPATRSQVMGQMMRSGIQMFMNMPPEQRQQLIQDAMQNMQGMFGPGGPGGGQGGR